MRVKHDSNDCRVSEVKPKNPNVIGSEKHFPPHEYSIENYEMFHKNLNNNTGRGMALFVSKSFEAPGVDFKTAPEAFIIVEVHLVKSVELLIVHTYLSDCGTEENKKSPIDLISEACSLQYSQLLYMGDFNYP